MLKEAGLTRLHCNLETARSHFGRVVTTHTYDDKLETIAAARDLGLSLCVGGLFGIGETDEQVLELALRLRAIEPEAVPVNFLIPIPGTPLESASGLNPRYCLKVLALFRLANPQWELRIAAGREIHLGSLQPLGLYPANSIFVGDYLTTKGQPPDEDYRMIEALGFEVAPEGFG